MLCAELYVVAIKFVIKISERSSHIFFLRTHSRCSVFIDLNSFELSSQFSFHLSFFILVKYILHKLERVNHFKMHTSAAFSIFAVLRNHHCKIPDGNSVSIKQSFPIPALLQPLATPNLLCLWIGPFWIFHKTGIIQYVGFGGLPSFI